MCTECREAKEMELTNSTRYKASSTCFSSTYYDKNALTIMNLFMTT